MVGLKSVPNEMYKSVNIFIFFTVKSIAHIFKLAPESLQKACSANLVLDDFKHKTSKGSRKRVLSPAHFFIYGNVFLILPKS